MVSSELEASVCPVMRFLELLRTVGEGQLRLDCLSDRPGRCAVGVELCQLLGNEEAVEARRCLADVERSRSLVDAWLGAHVQEGGHGKQDAHAQDDWQPLEALVQETTSGQARCSR